MISHVYLGTNDFARATAFYARALAALGLRQRFCDSDYGWAAWVGKQGGRPLFIVGRTFDGAPAAPGNGHMIALTAPSRAAVAVCHAAALAAGGADEGAPGLRPRYHQHYDGAYFRDLDGNKLCVVCHDPE